MCSTISNRKEKVSLQPPAASSCRGTPSTAWQRTWGSTSCHNSYISGNAFEALVGAIYLDRGYKYCMWFLRRRIIAEHLNLDKVANKEVNFKSKLLEWAQKNKLQTDFALETPPQKNGEPLTFHSEVIIEGIVCGKGNGYSKKESQQKAAREALHRLRHEKEHLNAVLKSKEKRTAIEEEIISLPPKTDCDTVTAKSRKPRRHSSAPKREPGMEKKEEQQRQNRSKTETEEKGRPAPNAKTQKNTAAKKQSSKEDIIAEAESKAFAKQEEYAV